VSIVRSYGEVVVRAFLEQSSVVWAEAGAPPSVPCHFVAHRASGGALAISVVHRKIQRMEHWSSTTHNYVDGQQLRKLIEWSERESLVPVISHALLANLPGGPGPFVWGEADYYLVGIDARSYRRRAKPRARSSSWEGKVCLSSDVFAAHARPLSDWLLG
jgi:hypothetical protein